MNRNDSLHLDSVHRHKMLLMRNTLIVLSLLCLVFFVKAILSAAILRIVGLSFAALCCALSFYYVRLKLNGVALTLMFSALWLGVCIASLTSGPTALTVLGWFVVSIVLAGLLGGERFCLKWSICVAFTLAGLWLLQAYWPLLSQLTVEEQKPLHLRMHIAAQLVVVTMVMLSVAKTNNDYQKMIEEQGSELKQERRRRMLAEEKAARAAQTKTQFLDNIRYEFRTPINSIIGFAKRLSNSDVVIGLQEQEAAKAIERNSESLLVLFDDLLDLSSLNEDSLHYSAQPFLLETLLSDCLEGLSPVAQEFGLQLRHSTMEGMPNIEMEGDLQQLELAVQTLLYFSIRQTIEGEIEVHYTQTSRNGVSGVTIGIADSSPGIPAEQLNSLFECNYEFVCNSNRDLPISPMSLVKAAKIVKLHGGTVEVKSELERGTRFFVWLPLQRPVSDALWERT